VGQAATSELWALRLACPMVVLPAIPGLRRKSGERHGIRTQGDPPATQRATGCAHLSPPVSQTAAALKRRGKHRTDTHLTEIGVSGMHVASLVRYGGARRGAAWHGACLSGWKLRAHLLAGGAWERSVQPPRLSSMHKSSRGGSVPHLERVVGGRCIYLSVPPAHACNLDTCQPRDIATDSNPNPDPQPESRSATRIQIRSASESAIRIRNPNPNPNLAAAASQRHPRRPHERPEGIASPHLSN